MDADERRKERGPTLSAWIAERRLPIATASVLVITSAATVLEFFRPEVLGTLQQDPGALADGEWWRLITPLLVPFLIGGHR